MESATARLGCLLRTLLRAGLWHMALRPRSRGIPSVMRGVARQAGPCGTIALSTE